MDYPAYTRLSYYNPTTTTPATYLFFRHRIGNNEYRESWIYYYEPDDTPPHLIPKLPITSEKAGSNKSSKRDYWYFHLVTDSHTYKIADNFYCSFLNKDSSTNNCDINIVNMKFRTFFYLPDGSPGSSGCTKRIS